MTHSSHHSDRSLRLQLRDEAATARLAAALATALGPGLRIYLRGALGAGKTTLARGLLRALGFQGRVKSPSYTLVEVYSVSRLNLYHFDFFRFRDPKEWSDSGLREYFEGDAICLVEWPEKADALLPRADLDIYLAVSGRGREALLEAHTEAGEKCLVAAAERKSEDGSI